MPSTLPTVEARLGAVEEQTAQLVTLVGALRGDLVLLQRAQSAQSDAMRAVLERLVRLERPVTADAGDP